MVDGFAIGILVGCKGEKILLDGCVHTGQAFL
jgi:hypothetical protein